MKAKKLSRTYVRDSRRAAVFTHPRFRRILLWFTRRPKSVGETAAAIGMDLRRTHYYVQKLAALGLIAVVEERARAGRAVKLYRAISDSFFVPHDAAPKGFGDDLACELRESLNRERSQSEGGILFTAFQDGSPRGRIIGGRGASTAATEMWRVLRLGADGVAALKRDLNAVLNRHQRRRSESGGALYLVHAAVARRLEPEGIADNDGADYSALTRLPSVERP
jgi:hypothetical protein